MLITSWLLIIIGVILLFIAAIGILRLPDALSRQHAATKATTLAISFFIAGLTIYALASGWSWGWLARLIMLLFILLLTLPIAAHALVRSALCEKSEQIIR